MRISQRGWSLLAYFATDAHEAADALAHAQRLAGKSSPSEMLFVRWIAAQKQNDQIAAISNLNDLTKRECDDKFILYLAGRWLWISEISKKRFRFLKKF